MPSQKHYVLSSFPHFLFSVGIIKLQDTPRSKFLGPCPRTTTVTYSGSGFSELLFLPSSFSSLSSIFIQKVLLDIYRKNQIKLNFIITFSITCVICVFMHSIKQLNISSIRYKQNKLIKFFSSDT